MEKVKQLEEILKELISLSKKQKKLYKYYESHPVKTDKAKFKRFEKIITMSQELIILSIKFKTLSAQSYSKFPPGGIAVKPNTDEKIIKNDKDNNEQ